MKIKNIFIAFFIAMNFSVFSQVAQNPVSPLDEEFMPQNVSDEENELPKIPNLPDISMISAGIQADFDEFLIGEDTQTSTEKRYVKNFLINKFETSYRLWYEVRILAEQNGYFFENPGQQGSGGRRGKLPTEQGEMQPVTAISWKDAIVWCNALSEICNLQPAYSVRGEILRDSREQAKCDLAECNFDCNGFRLLTESEWEYAARKMADGKFQKGDFPSGVTTVEQSLENAGCDVAWFETNSSGTHDIGTTEKANSLGLFDMSGNVLEFCWDWYGDFTALEEQAFYAGPKYGYERVCRGGSWSPYASYILAGDRYSFMSDEAYNYLGFRFAKSK